MEEYFDGPNISCCVCCVILRNKEEAKSWIWARSRFYSHRLQSLILDSNNVYVVNNILLSCGWFAAPLSKIHAQIRS